MLEDMVSLLKAGQPQLGRWHETGYPMIAPITMAQLQSRGITCVERVRSQKAKNHSKPTKCLKMISSQVAKATPLKTVTTLRMVGPLTVLVTAIATAVGIML